jgi:hypothetical protein
MHFDSAAVALDDVAGDRQAETKTAASERASSPLKNGSNTFSRSATGIPGPSSVT